MYFLVLVLVPFVAGLLRPRWWALLLPVGVVAGSIALEAVSGRLWNHYEDSPLVIVGLHLMTLPVGVAAAGAGIALGRRSSGRR